MKRGSTKVHSFRLLWLVVIGALIASTASCEFFYRLLNHPPVAGFTIGPSTVGAAPFAVAVSAATSSDPDENIEDYAWDFGDGTPAQSGASTTHTYSGVGTYTIVLTVTDKYGETSIATKTVSVIPAQAVPTASFTASPTSGPSPLTVAFDASASSYADGTIQSYAWEFGDGSSGSGATVWHTYSTSVAKSYVVTLTVRASDGETASTTRTITVSVSNNNGPTTGAPSARFDVAPTLGVAPLQVVFNPEDSEADEGRTLILYTWSFGDSDATSDINPSEQTHVYTTDTTSKTFSVTLLVLDNEGDSDSVVKTVKAYNHRPIAGFEIANPPGGETEADDTEMYQTAAAAHAAGNAIWEHDDVVIGDLQNEGAGTLPMDVFVVIRSKKIPDDDWYDLTADAQTALVMADGTKATSSSTPAAPTGYADHNFSYDPEGQLWDVGGKPTWFPNQAWGIRYLYVDWGDTTAEEQIKYAEDKILVWDALYGGDVVVAHEYENVGVDGTVKTIKVRAEDWLGYESASVSRTVTIKLGKENADED